MMTTCRLLCALLVLALCCCPSVCEADTDLDPNTGAGGKAIKPTSPDSQPPTAMPEVVGVSDSEPAPKAEDLSNGTTMITAVEVPTRATEGSHETISTTDAPAKENKTTTTTQAPTTTTTTTTTTQAPSTTTTEVPTTTTTRAPSRLREIDGSLSSSAWVCAPLLLAASALAYTTVG
ncbi:putative mucin TcMUCII [Trypanosoma cruzi]|nr:putative mucin TcMUCII [Trypanosoma cruzi]